MEFLDYSLKDKAATVKMSIQEVTELRRLLYITFSEYEACRPFLGPGLIDVDRARLYELETEFMKITDRIGDIQRDNTHNG
jgi:hypothetical protein